MSLLLTVLQLAASVQQADPPPAPPEQAAGSALMTCVAHAMGGRIGPENAKALSGNGMVLRSEPPPFMQATDGFGKGTFAQAVSTEGQIWAVGYEQGVCRVMTIGTPAPPISGRFEQLFAIPNSWKRISSKEDSAGFKSDYQWQIGPKRWLRAYIVNTKLPAGSPARGVVSVTISPDNRKL